MFSPPRSYVLKALDRYWPRGRHRIEALPMPKVGFDEHNELPPKMLRVVLPEWAREISVNAHLLVPAAACTRSADWKDVDWIAASFWYLHAWPEREHERRHGPVHSYSTRLKGWDPEMWSHAWVNRIAMFMRLWAVSLAEESEEALFGPRPRAEILLTHDVDAIRKTFAIRTKQSLFHAFNAARLLLRGRVIGAVRKAASALKFAATWDDYWRFDEILELEDRFERRSIFNFYAGPPGNERGLKQRILDPAYDVGEERVRQQLRSMHQRGWEIGLHQSFDAWQDHELMSAQKSKLENALGEPVQTCRQHWLRFSFADTWKSQVAAGFRQDTTLGFNDRSGFRNGAALAFHPWDEASEQAMSLEAWPMVLMDSHLFDYADDEGNCSREITRWLDEVYAVGGQASVLWHQRVMSPDYGWGEGYAHLLSALKTQA